MIFALPDWCRCYAVRQSDEFALAFCVRSRRVCIGARRLDSDQVSNVLVTRDENAIHGQRRLVLIKVVALRKKLDIFLVARIPTIRGQALGNEWG